MSAKNTHKKNIQLGLTAQSTNAATMMLNLLLNEPSSQYRIVHSVRVHEANQQSLYALYTHFGGLHQQYAALRPAKKI